MSILQFFALPLAGVFLAFDLALAQIDTLRFATYNLLKFPNSQGTSRIPHFHTVLSALQPDLLVVQELETEQGQLAFLNQVLNADQPNLYQAAPFVNGFDTDNGLFYRPDKITLLGANRIHTPLRDIAEYVVAASGQEMHIFSVHLKASSGSSNENRRLGEATILRNYLNALPAGTNFLVAGDFNIYRSSEPAFVRLTESQADDDGRVFDPLNAAGNWNNNSSFAGIHSQATRTAALNDSGATGGLDDRFDMILVSNGLRTPGGADILPGSYRAFGNDGRHFNQAINLGTNAAVSATVATALYFASDHLPVFSDFVFGTSTAVAERRGGAPSALALLQNYPNPFNAETRIAFQVFTPLSHASLRVYDLTGSLVKTLWQGEAPAGEYALAWDGRDDSGARAASGVYFYKLEVEGLLRVRKMILLE